jgi:16S rRNA (cytosine967-C5)-methyltransferase
MQPAARVQSAIELLDLVIAAARDNGAAADVIIAQWFRDRRYAGSKDRRAVRELVYRAIRSFGTPPVSGRAAILGLNDLDALFDGSPHGPGVAVPNEPREQPSLIPAWLESLIPEVEHKALLERAPLDVRVNTLKSQRDDVMALLDGAMPIVGTVAGLRLPENTPLGAMPALNGLVEVQDAGSQLIALGCQVRPGQTLVDLCAGAGGKTLALAAEMQAQGKLIACDTDRGRLSRLLPRAQMAGAHNIEIRLLNPKRENDALSDLHQAADLVLVDAPCSGTGTWRRNPELRWRLNPQRLDQVVALQKHVLDIGATLVRSGGALVYAVCSLLDQEGRDQIDAFLVRNASWVIADLQIEPGRPHGGGRMLTPEHDNTDGFFMARLEKL